VFGPVLRGEGVTLRPPTPDDAQRFVDWFADTEVTRFLGRRTPPAKHEEEEWLKKLAEGDNDVFWTIETEGTPIGAIGIHEIDWINAHASTGIMIGDKSYWRRGIASEAMRLRTRFAFRELNLHKLSTEVFADNVASRRALEKAGYRQVGIRREERWSDGRWHDMWLAEVLRADWERDHAQS